MLEFVSRTAVQSEKELLSSLEEAVSQPQLQSNESGSLSEFRRIIANVQKNERSAFRQIRTVEPVNEIQPPQPPTSGISITRIQALSRQAESESQSPSESQSQSQSPSSFPSQFQSQFQASSLQDAAGEASLPPETDLAYGSGEESGVALRGLLKELNDWLSAGIAPVQTGAATGLRDDSQSTEQRSTSESLMGRRSQGVPDIQLGEQSRDQSQVQSRDQVRDQFRDQSITQSQIETTSMVALTGESVQLSRRFGFEQSRDWNYSASIKAAQDGQPERVRSKLSPLLEAARRMVVGVKNLPLGRRIESHENGAMLEKDELGRVTQIRAQSGEIISVYYGRDCAPEGFVRTDARGVLHSVAECDAQGVVLRDENGRVRAAGDSLSIDPLGRISICRSDGQYWSIDLARQMLSEKRRLADQTGKWTALTAVFAADGFRMMTLFQKLTPAPGKSTVRSQDDANRIWSRAAVESGHFRFYGRDGSTIEFTSEEALASLIPAHVSSPGVRPIEPRWHARHQAGTAWQSVHEYVVSYLAV
jgi:hypothetical protein